MKGEAGDISVRLADFLPAFARKNFASDRAGGVFHNWNVVTAPYLNDRFQIARHPHLVNAQDRFRPLSERLLDQLRIDVEGCGIDIDENRARPAVADAVRRCDVGMTDGDDFIAGLYANRQ